MSKGCLLVAGGAGYIGSVFCAEAKKTGYTPIILDRLTSESERITAWRRQAARIGPLEIADYGDSEAVAAIIQKHKPIAAICFAGFIEVGASVKDPESFWDNNFFKALRFFHALERGGVRHVVFSSTAAVYGNSVTDRALIETDELAPINPYGMTKLACEVALQGLINHQDVSDSFIEEFVKRCQSITTTYPAFRVSFFPCLKSVCLRYFNAAGADNENDLGEMHDPETHLIPNALLAGKDRVFTLNGSDYLTQDGTCVRDYIHVKDLAEAHLAALHYLMKGGENNVFNLGTSKGSSVKEVLEGIKKIRTTDFTIHTGPRREGDPVFLVANADKANQILEWYPRHNLNDIITSAAAFHAKHGHS